MGGEPSSTLGQFGLSHVTAFAQVVDAGSFTDAARQLGLSKATISKHVAHLEHRLGASLLRRTTRSLGLTEAGARFYSHCRNILDELAVAESEVLESLGAAQGRLRVATPNFFDGQKIAPALHDFMERYPAIEVELSLHDAMGEGSGEEKADVSIQVARIQECIGRGIQLAPCVARVYGSPGYIERYGEPMTPDDLSRHNCMRIGSGRQGGTWALEGPEGPWSVNVSGRFCANSGAALQHAVLSGLGLSLMPESLVADDLAAGRLVNVLPSFRDRSQALYLEVPEGRRKAPQVAAFTAFATSYFETGHT